MNKSNIALAVSTIAIILGIMAVCVAAYRTPELGFDYMGVIVGMLSLIVTILVGLNLYALIDFNKSKKELEKDKEWGLL